jgi:hypothetical protein
VTRTVLVLGSVLAALVFGAGDARATNECRGLMVCVPVAGPWVVVPAATRRVEWQLACPRRYVVGGLDAELSDRALDVTFPGNLGSPVNPGITTTTRAVFLGFYTGARARVATFRPHIGCIPSSGGGGSPPTFRTVAATSPQVFPPGRPLTRRVRTVNVGAGTSRVLHGCGRGERLLGSSHAIGFDTRVPPASAIVAAVRATRTVRAGRVVVRVDVAAVARNARAAVQVHALCAGAGR